MTIRLESVSLEDAQRVIAAAQAKAEEIGSPSNIAVVDAGANLVSHIRMDNAWVGSVDISINKAFTARAFDIATKDLAENAHSPASSSTASRPRTMAGLWSSLAASRCAATAWSSGR